VTEWLFKEWTERIKVHELRSVGGDFHLSRRVGSRWQVIPPDTKAVGGGFNVLWSQSAVVVGDRLLYYRDHEEPVALLDDENCGLTEIFDDVLFCFWWHDSKFTPPVTVARLRRGETIATRYTVDWKPFPNGNHFLGSSPAGWPIVEDYALGTPSLVELTPDGVVPVVVARTGPSR
jgi:hypothetical protein